MAKGNNRFSASEGLSRRSLLTGMAASGIVAGMPGFALASPLGRATKIQHLSVSVSNLKTSAMFYQKLCGFEPIRSLPPPGSETYGWNFNGHLLSQTRVNSKDKAGRISHYCVTVDNFNAERDGAALKAAGFQKVSIDHKDEDDWLIVPDPDGVPVQIFDTNYYADCKACGVPPDDAAQPTPKEPIFHPTRLNIGITSSDLQTSSDFYRKLFGFGPGRPLPGGELGFDVGGDLISIALTPKEQAGKITHFTFGVDNFNKERAAARLAKAGIAVVEEPKPNKDWLFIKDPDGTAVQILDTNYRERCIGCKPLPIKA